MWEAQLATLDRLFHAARRNRLELLIEVIPSRVGPVDDRTTATVIRLIYAQGITPDWWKLEAQPSAAAWAATIAAIEENDPHTRGILVLGLDAPADQLAASFALAAARPLVRGFAVGRTIFGAPARDWFAGTIDDGTAVARMVDRYTALCTAWDQARTGATR
jgi:5-dehydro-2-deoxygluconokinase